MGENEDKIDVQHVYTEVTFAIGSQLIRNAQDDSEPIADLQRNKHRVPYCQREYGVECTPQQLSVKLLDFCCADKTTVKSVDRREYGVECTPQQLSVKLLDFCCADKTTVKSVDRVSEEIRAALNSEVLTADKGLFIAHSRYCFLPIAVSQCGAAVVEWLACSPSNKAIRVQSRAGSLRVGIVPDDTTDRWVFSRISPFFPRPCIPALLHSNLIGSQDLDVKNHPNLCTLLHCSFESFLNLGTCDFRENNSMETVFQYPTRAPAVSLPSLAAHPRRKTGRCLLGQ
ncbi:hypothetical protein PR048_022462 [Dryococelus australis]|uniref:Uncharacterized protein n=1 Tax=Dryococelus australis TaxID=614101 RepID=A0ABQ9H152_9NEOP|nr:hypothetical protein PR048_022462 [Dryococelus australis]